MKKRKLFSIIILACVFPVFGYVGPGAGFAFAGSFLFIFAAFFLALFNFLTFPIRALIKFIKRYRTLKNAKFKRTIIIGFDGMDYNLLKKLMQKGHSFPHFAELEKKGAFAPLYSTEPPISPVAWSTFSTGVNPGKHNIFDFLTTDRHTYMPKLACSDILKPKKYLKFRDYEIPLGKARIELKRKSTPFWKLVSEKGIFSSVLRVPFTFPPEKFYGLMLSGLGAPDLRGTQGSFSFFSSAPGAVSAVSEGLAEKLEKTGENMYSGSLTGPGHPFKHGNPPLKIPFTVRTDPAKKTALVTIGKEKITLEQGKISSWIRVSFKAGLISVSGIVQLTMEELEPLQLYFSPINIDPESPVMPVSHPRIFSVYLSKQLGAFATLGMAEDTTALNEGVLSEEGLLDQIYYYQEERERIFFDTMSKYKKGLLVQVFEATDRIQHMFWQYLEDGTAAKNKRIKNAIPDVYKAMDNFLGRLMPKLGPDDLLMIVSDHGFNSAKREFHLNSWLHSEGYLVLNEGKTTSGKWYADVDWSKSRAYGQGLNGLFLNMQGREKHGVVKAGKEAEQLKEEIKEKLLKVIDPKTAQPVMKGVYKREELYKGPYVQNAPDVVIGYNIGHKVSWESAVNFIGGPVFSDNMKPWTGDHCFTSLQVPGIFFSNHKISKEKPTLADISPTVLDAFGITPPAFIDGQILGVKQ